MARQKVKGTGHKQPADAQTEPNFYVLPPTTGPHSPGTPPQIAAASPTSHSPAPVAAPSFITEMSPGTRGVHGAASLLKGIAAGLTPSRLKNIRVNPNSALPYCDPAGPASSSKSDPPGHNSAFAPASVPPRSSYSSLLWGTAAATRDEPSSAPAPAPAPSASYLWPQPAAAPQGKLDPEDEDEEDEQQEADEEEEEEEDQKQAAV